MDKQFSCQRNRFSELLVTAASKQGTFQRLTLIIYLYLVSAHTHLIDVFFS